MKPKLSLIAGIGANDRAIGKKNGLLWHIKEDLKRFKEVTLGHPIIMGRKTLDSIGRTLPGRANIVITRQPEYKIEGATVVSSLEEAISEARKIENTEIFIIGGGTIYEQALPFADKLYLTLVDAEDKEADTFFPEYKNLFTREVFREEHKEHVPPYTFIELEK